MDALPKQAERLLSVSPDDFVAERQQLVKELRGAGKRDEADAVAGLRKPPPVVLAANRAARDRPEAARTAARAAQRVAKAQLSADPDGYKAALAELDDSLDLLAEVALAHLSKDAKPPTEAVARRLRAVLRNAVADEEVRKELERGVLREETEAAGFGAFAGATPRSAPRRPKSKAGEDVDARRKRLDEKRREREQALSAELDSAEEALDDAERAERDATRARERAERAVSSLRSRLERLREGS